MSNFSKYIEGKIKELEEIARRGTSRIADELTETANSAIDEYYSWTPTRYKRQKAIVGSPVRYYRNPHNTIYRGGVEMPMETGGKYHANYLKDHPSVSDAYIAELFYAGRHGATECFPEWVLSRVQNTPPVMSPSPREILTMKQEEIKANITNYFF